MTANPVALASGTFTGTGSGSWVPVVGIANASLQGGEGTCKLEKSYDGGSTAIDASRDGAGSQAIYAVDAGTPEVSVLIENHEAGVLFRWTCTDYTDDIAHRISQ